MPTPVLIGLLTPMPTGLLTRRRQVLTAMPTAMLTAMPTAMLTAMPTGRGQRKLTPRLVRALRDKRHRGVSIEALMEEYALSRASVFRYLQSEKR
jgi:hypothetical protein